MTGPGSRPALYFKRVTRRFGGVTALRELDLVCLPSVATCLIGPNGAGKSTALALAAGLLPPTMGLVRFGGQHIEVGTAQAFSSYLPQSTAFPVTFTVKEVVDFTAAVRSSCRAECEEVLDVTGLRQVMARRVKALSGGWLRRLGLACALLPPAACLLLDEPFIGLDPDTQTRLVDHLNERVISGAILVVASHDFEVVDLLSPRVVVLNNGQNLGEPQAVSDGSRALYRRLLSRPENVTGRREQGHEQ